MRLPSKVEGKASFVIAILATLVVAWSLTKGWSCSCKAVGRNDGSRCKHSLIKLFASLERWSGISGTSLLFPILKIAATCDIQHNKIVQSTNVSLLTLTKDNVYKQWPEYPISHPFVLTPRWFWCCHFKNSTSQAPNIHHKAVAICIHYNLRMDNEHNETWFSGRRKRRNVE